MDFRPLPERPEPRVISVEDLLDRARTGAVRVPPLQRGLRWRRTDVADLFDSIVRGYPIGSLLVNQAPGPAEPVRFGPFSVAGADRGDVWWLVDGQQRVTSLVAALLHPEPSIGGTFAVWVSLRSTEFRVADSRLGSEWLPLNLLGDRTRLHQWSRTVQYGPETDAMVNRAFELEKLVTQYKLTVFVVRDAPPETIRAIFGRTNSAGRPLEEDEIVDALFGDDQQGKPLRRLSVDLESTTGFGRLDTKWLLRCVKAVAGPSQKVRFDERHQLSAELVERTFRGLTRTVELLQTRAAIPHVTVLPYRLPLLVLTRFFDAHPNPSDRNLELLVRWLWRGAASGQHARTSDADIAGHIADLSADEDRSVQALLARVPSEPPLPPPNTRWNAQAALTRREANVVRCVHRSNRTQPGAGGARVLAVACHGLRRRPARDAGERGARPRCGGSARQRGRVRLGRSPLGLGPERAGLRVPRPGRRRGGRSPQHLRDPPTSRFVTSPIGAEVRVHDVRVGYLWRLDDDENHEFRFDEGWLADPGRPMLGQVFEDWRPRTLQTSGLPVWFDHLLPQDAWSRALHRWAGLPEDCPDIMSTPSP